jgi:hypothetical protein
MENGGIDMEGKMLIPIIYKLILIFQKDMQKVTLNGKMVIMSTDANIIFTY